MKRLHLALSLAILTAALTGCQISPSMAPRKLMAVRGVAEAERMAETEWKWIEPTGPAAGASAQTIAMDEPAADSKKVAQQKRQIIYSAHIAMVVEQLTPGLREVRKIADDCGGYMHSMDGRSISIRVPADQFDDAVKRIEDLGSVTDRRVKGDDVTEELNDLDVRLKNALQMRDRLVKLLEKAAKVEDALLIEKELGRITEKIEQFKGRMKFLNDGVAFSSITVALSTPAPRANGRVAKLRQVPFGWVRELGSEIAKGSPEYYTDDGNRFFRIHFNVPVGYVKYDEERDYTRAMSGDAVLIKVQRNSNPKGGNLEFWKRIVLRSLTEQKMVEIAKTEEVRLNDGSKAVLVSGTRKLGHQTIGYMLAVACVKKRVYAFEAWGTGATVKSEKEKLMKSILSVRIR